MLHCSLDLVQQHFRSSRSLHFGTIYECIYVGTYVIIVRLITNLYSPISETVEWCSGPNKVNPQSSVCEKEAKKDQGSIPEGWNGGKTSVLDRGWRTDGKPSYIA